jgi:hypothetical protein
MKHLISFKDINENAQLAKKIIIDSNYDANSPEYIELKNLMSRTPNLLGMFTKFLVEDNISIDDIRRLLRLLKVNKDILNKLPKAVHEYSDFNELNDDVEELEYERKAKKLLNEIKGDIRRELFELDKDKQKPYIDLASRIMNEFTEADVKVFTSSLSRVKDLDDLMVDMQLFVNKMKDKESFEKLISKIEETDNSKVVYKNEKNKVIVARIADYVDSYKLGSFKWCISNETGMSQWNNYVENENNAQYFAWNLNYEKHESLHIVGVTIKKDGTVRECQDSQNRPEIFEDFIKTCKIPSKVFRPLNKKELKEKEVQKAERERKLAEFEAKLKAEKAKIRAHRAAERQEDGEWDDDPYPNAMKEFLIEQGELEEGESVYVLEEQDHTHYGLRIFSVGDDGKEWAIGNDDEATEAAKEDLDNLLDDIGIGGDRWLIGKHIDGDKVADYYGYDYDYIAEEPDNWGIEKSMKEGAQEKLDTVTADKDTLYEKLETLKKGTKLYKETLAKIEELEEIISQIEDEDNDYYWEYSDDDINSKVEELNQDIKDDPLDKLEEMGLISFDKNGRIADENGGKKLLEFIDKDAYIEDCIDTDGRGHMLSGYDGTENEINYDGTYYFIYRIN